MNAVRYLTYLWLDWFVDMFHDSECTDCGVCERQRLRWRRILSYRSRKIVRNEVVKIRTIHDETTTSEVEFYDEKVGEWRWIGRLTWIERSYVFESSDDSLRAEYDSLETAIEQLLIAGGQGRL